MRIQNPDRWKTVITWGAVAASTAVLGYFLFRIPRAPLVKYVALGFTAFIEITMCFALGTAFAYWRRDEGKDRTIAKWLFAFWGTYVFIGLIGAVALFMSEIQSTNTAAEAVRQTSTRYDTGYQEALQKEREYGRLMSEEEKSGRGWKWEQYRVTKEEATRDRKHYESLLDSSKQNDQEVQDDIKGGLDQLFGAVWMYLLIAVFTIIMLVPYVAQLIAAWEIPLPPKKQQANSDAHKYLAGAQEESGEKPVISIPSEPIEPPKVISEPDPPKIAFKYPEIVPRNPVLTKPIDNIRYISRPIEKIENIPQNVQSVPENKPIGESQQIKIASLLQPNEMPQLFDFIEGLYADVDDSNIGTEGVELNGLMGISQKTNLTYYKCRRFNGILNRIGAVMTENGIPSRGLWPKSKIIEFINENVKEGS